MKTWAERIEEYESEHKGHTSATCKTCKETNEWNEFLDGWSDDTDINVIYDAYFQLKEEERMRKNTFGILAQYLDEPSESKSGSPLFPAKWAGKCKECGDTYKRGDDVGYAVGMPGPLCMTCHDLHDTFIPYSEYHY